MVSKFANNLKTARKKKKLTQGELGKAVGVGNTTICGYENGSNQPSIEILMKLTEKLEVTMDYLCGNQSTNNCYVQYVNKDLYRLELENQLAELDKYYDSKKQELLVKLASLEVEK